MTLDLALVLALLATTILMLVRGRPRMDVAALIMIAALPLTGVLTLGEAFADFVEIGVPIVLPLWSVFTVAVDEEGPWT